MTPERMAALVAGWVRLYTRNLPAPVARRRSDEIAADLHDHIAHERANGVGDRRIALEIASRMIRGLADDASWRGDAKAAARASSLEGAMNTSTTVSRSILRVILGVALILSLLLTGMLLSGDVGWSLGDFVAAGAFLAVIGVVLELALRRAGSLPAAFAVAALGVVAALFGEADDAPGLVLIGLVLIVSAGALGLRVAHRGN